MDLERLAHRLRTAHSRFSLRQIAKWCSGKVSHEYLRTIITNGCPDTISIGRYEALDNGLSANGF